MRGSALLAGVYSAYLRVSLHVPGSRMLSGLREKKGRRVVAGAGPAGVDYGNRITRKKKDKSRMEKKMISRKKTRNISRCILFMMRPLLEAHDH